MIRRGVVIACAIGLLVGGAGGWALAKKGAATSALYKGKAPEEAARALLQEAEREAGGGSWELIGVGRTWYLGGNREKGQALFDRITGGKPEPSDWFRIGQVYAEAGEWDRAKVAFDEMLRISPKDDTGMVFAGAWRNLAGDREGAEVLFDRAFDRSPGEFWHMVNAAGSYLGVPPR